MTINIVVHLYRPKPLSSHIHTDGGSAGANLPPRLELNLNLESEVERPSTALCAGKDLCLEVIIRKMRKKENETDLFSLFIPIILIYCKGVQKIGGSFYWYNCASVIN